MQTDGYGSARHPRLFNELLGLARCVEQNCATERRFPSAAPPKQLEPKSDVIEAALSFQLRGLAHACHEAGCEGDPDRAAHVAYSLLLGLLRLRPIAATLGVRQRLETTEARVELVLEAILRSAVYSNSGPTPRPNP
jgi:hypothetical protein